MAKTVFPLSSVDAPIARNFHQAPRKFGSNRDHGRRLHAGCDLYAEPGTAVMAVADGKVLSNPYAFYDGVYALEVVHPGIGTVRYGEIYGAGESEHADWLCALKKGDTVTAGQVIAHVGKMGHVPASMIHFELFSGTGHGPLTVRGHQAITAPVPTPPPAVRRPPPLPTPLQPWYEHYVDVWRSEYRTLEDFLWHDQHERTVAVAPTRTVAIAPTDPPLRYELYMRRSDLINPAGFLDSLPK